MMKVHGEIVAATISQDEIIVKAQAGDVTIQIIVKRSEYSKEAIIKRLQEAFRKRRHLLAHLTDPFTVEVKKLIGTKFEVGDV